jgi:hypothetical protein
MLYIITESQIIFAPEKMDISDSDKNDSEDNVDIDGDMTSISSFDALEKTNAIIHTDIKNSESYVLQKCHVDWEGDDSADPNPPQVSFRKSSDLMSRHAEIYIKKSMIPKYYNSSDGGRRNKVVNISNDIWTTSESEYESPDEEEYYDPRQISKWKWETDYTSLPSDYDSSSTKSDDELSYKECKFMKN